MYEGIRNKGLKELVEKLEDDQLYKRDLIVPSKFIEVNEGDFIINDLPANLFDRNDVDRLLAEFNISTSEGTGMPFDISDNALYQISDKLSIPIRFLRYVKSDHLDLFDHNISTLMGRANKNYLIRSFAPREGSEEKGFLRAFLSDRYSMIDNLDVLYSALEAVKDAGANIELGKCNLTESNMYVEFIRPEAKITAEEYLNKYRSPDGGKDPNIYAGFVISNSETGNGKYKITPRMIIGACSNGLLFKRDAMGSAHVGYQKEEGISWSQRTRDKEVEFIRSQMQDAISHFMSEDFLIEKMEELSEYRDRLDHPIEAIGNMSSDLMLNKEDKQDILNYFIEGGDFSPVGVLQAVTYHAHEIDDADRQYELEGAMLDTLPSFKQRYDRPE